MSRNAFLSYTSELGRHPQPTSFVTAASSAIVRAGFRPVEMNYLTAADAAPADVCAGKVRECEAFVGLIGFRYGSPVMGQPEVSHVQLELDAASAARCHRLIFLLGENTRSIPASALIDRQYGHRQDEFRDRLRSSNMVVAEFSHPDQLELLVFQAVVELRDEGRGLSLDDERIELRREISLIVTSAEAQGWRVRTNSVSALRLVAPGGTAYSLPLGEADVTRDELRPFARRLSDAGLRLNGSLLSPVGSPPANPYS